MTHNEASQIEEMYHHYNYRCFVCGKEATQRAHIIANTSLNKLLYGKKIVDNPLDWLPACSLECNKLMDAGKIPARAELIKSILESDMDMQDKRDGIESLVRENIALKRSKTRKA